MFNIAIILFLLINLRTKVHSFQKINADLDTNPSTSCQSGLREDNTNYIYCARQSLRLIPNLNQIDSGGGGGGGGSGIYDELVLSDNLIERIDAHTFSSTLKVKKLYLDANPLRFIHADAFKHLRNYLEEIYFEQKLVETIESHEELIDSGDDMNIFDQSILRTCFNLRSLSIKSYTIHLLDGYKLARLNKLESLSITNAKLKFLDEFAFVGVENSLLELNLNGNSLDVIPTSSLERLKRLRRLSLAQNLIKHIHANAFFRVASSLQSLDLSYNLVKRVDENAFNGPVQNSLKFVYIQNNELKWANFVHLLYNLRWLQDLNVDFNKLGVASASIGQNLTQINWPESDYNIETMPLELTSLSMQGNSLTESTLQLFTHAYNYERDVVVVASLSSSSKISSSNSQRKKFTFAKLKKLNLARNKIHNLPTNIFTSLNTSQLKTLVLDRNPIETSRFNARTFEGAHRSLASLSLNGIDFVFESKEAIDALNLLENLQTLKLNGNGKRMQRKIETELNLKSLVSLEMQSNGLSEFPKFLCNLERLRELDLSSNRLKAFDLDCLLFKLSRNESVYETTALRQLNLNNNPLKCDCKMRKLKMWLMRNYDRDLLELIRWKCFEPFELNGKYLNSINLEEFTCPNIESTTIVTTSSTKSITGKSTVITPTLILAKIEDTDETIKDFLAQQQKSHILPIIFDNEQHEEIATSQSSMPSQVQITNATLPHTEFSYYSLIVGISLSISFICLLILVIFYLFCLNKNNNNNKSSTYESNTNNKYLGDFLSSNSKYDFKFCSPPLSSSSSSTTSSTSTSSSIAYSKNSSKCLDLSSDIFQTNTIKPYGGLDSSNTCRNCHAIDNNFNNSNNNNNPYNHLNNSIFSINLQQHNSDTHIYHEINTPSKGIVARTSHGQLQSHFLYENNLNYLVMPPQTQTIPPPSTNTLLFENKNINYRSNNLVNDFSNSLFV